MTSEAQRKIEEILAILEKNPEGNTYSQLDTQKLVEEGITAEGKVHPTFPRKFNYLHIFRSPMTQIAAGLAHQGFAAEISRIIALSLWNFYS